MIFTGFGDSSLDLELRAWTSTRVTRPRKFASDLYFAVFEALQREGIEIPFPQRDLHARSVIAPLGGGRIATDAPGATRAADGSPEPGERPAQGGE